MRFRRKPAAAVVGKLDEGGLNLLADCEMAAQAAGGVFKFTVTSPYMLSRSLLDCTPGISKTSPCPSRILAAQVRDLPCECVQVDEANIAGNPDDALLPRAQSTRCSMQ